MASPRPKDSRYRCVWHRCSALSLLAERDYGGVGGAIALPAASALTVVEGRRFGMGSTIAVFAMAFSIGMVIGPLVGGVIADFANINSVFYFGAAIGLAGTTLFIWFTK